MSFDDDACTKPQDSQNMAEPTEEQTMPDELKSLKHQLLGPSLTKAGQDTVDQHKVGTRDYVWLLAVADFSRYPK
jgi:hypothetical protein